MSDRTRTCRNGRAVEKPTPLVAPGYYEQSGAILAALGVVTGNPETRAAARRLIGDDNAYALCCRTALALMRANVFNRCADTETRLVNELVTLQQSHDYFNMEAHE